MRRVVGAAATLAVVAASLAGCGSGQVAVSAPSPSGAAATQCRHLLDALPQTVDGQQQRQISPADAAAAAWGDPPIVLRCGVAKPAALRPTSPCPTINNVGWFPQEQQDAWVFTTIGRSTYVEVRVPKDYTPEADALVDLAPAIKQATTWPHPCQ